MLLEVNPSFERGGRAGASRTQARHRRLGAIPRPGVSSVRLTGSVSNNDVSGWSSFVSVAGGRAYSGRMAGKVETALQAMRLRIGWWDANGRIAEVTGAPANGSRGDGGGGVRYRGRTAYTNTLLGISRKGADHFTRDAQGTLLGQRTPSNRYYPIADSLGSIVAVTDKDGNLVGRHDYEPFGAEQGSPAFNSPFRFAGELYQPSHKLYKIGARWYDPKLGRWTQPDLVTNPARPRQANRYLYAGQDPVNVRDPSGLWFGEDIIDSAGDAWEAFCDVPAICGDDEAVTGGGCPEYDPTSCGSSLEFLEEEQTPTSPRSGRLPRPQHPVPVEPSRPTVPFRPTFPIFP
jgi:RHS repeat-associated protein